MLTIDIAALEEGLHEVELTPASEDLDLDPERFSDVHVHARLDLRNRRLLVMLDAEATASLVCDRTLEPFDERLGGSYSLLFVPPEFTRKARDEDDFEEVRELLPADREIDVTDAVRDTLLLAVPQRCVAPHARDIDIETTFGKPKDAPVDPRWEALSDLDLDE